MLQAVPEDIPLDIVYEDEHLMVINKVRIILHLAHMVCARQCVCKSTIFIDVFLYTVCEEYRMGTSYCPTNI